MMIDRVGMHARAQAPARPERRSPAPLPPARAVPPPFTATGAPVLVLPMTERSGVNACRSLRAAGHTVLAAAITPRPGLRTRYADRTLRCPSPTDDPMAFARWVAETCAREGVRAVLPLDEETVKALMDVPLGGAVLAGPTARQYAMLGDKEGLAATAVAAGVDHPHGVIVDADGPQGDWPALPSVIKPVLSEPGSVGGEIVTVATARERDAAVRRMVDHLGRVLVQEWIDGEGWRVNFVRGASGTAFVCGRTVRRWPAATGMSSTTDFSVSDPAAVAAALRILDAADYRGCGSVQLLASGDRVLVHDVNVRPETSVGGAIAAGLDLPRLAVEVALGREWLPQVRQRPVRYVWFTAEVRALGRALARRSGADRPLPIARDLLRAAFTRDAVLDPGDVRDPLPLLGALGELGRWAAGGLRSRR
jgi:carbamoyl-phosphate synthase large subunit